MVPEMSGVYGLCTALAVDPGLCHMDSTRRKSAPPLLACINVSIWLRRVRFDLSSKSETREERGMKSIGENVALGMFR